VKPIIDSLEDILTLVVGGEKMTITKEEFQRYENVRASGVTNMFDIRTVENLSGLDRDTIIEIIKQYSELDKQYPDVRRRVNEAERTPGRN